MRKLDQFDWACRNMKYYYQLAQMTPCPWQRAYYENLLIQEAELFLHYEKRDNHLTGSQSRQEQVFTLTELAKFNGANGMPAYVAINGIIYDLSLEPTWGGGTHFGLYAGRDMTVQFSSCHANPSILGKLPRVGILQV